MPSGYLQEVRKDDLGRLWPARRSGHARSLERPALPRTREGCPHPRLLRAPLRPLKPERASEPAQHLLGVDAELLEKAPILVSVDFVGELRIGPRRRVVLAEALEEVDDLFLVEDHLRALSGWLVN